jgi:hypothetical protein
MCLWGLRRLRGAQWCQTSCGCCRMLTYALSHTGGGDSEARRYQMTHSPDSSSPPPPPLSLSSPSAFEESRDMIAAGSRQFARPLKRGGIVWGGRLGGSLYLPPTHTHTHTHLAGRDVRSAAAAPVSLCAAAAWAPEFAGCQLCVCQRI